MAYVVSWLFGTVVLPEMVRRSASPEDLKNYAKTWARWIAVTLTPCTVIAFLVAPRLMNVLYGPAFSRSGALASVMALACPFIFMNSIYTNVAIATNRKTGLMGLFAITATVAVLLDLASWASVWGNRSCLGDRDTGSGNVGGIVDADVARIGTGDATGLRPIFMKNVERVFGGTN